jgi:hypothetical protein
MTQRTVHEVISALGGQASVSQIRAFMRSRGDRQKDIDYVTSDIQHLLAWQYIRETNGAKQKPWFKSGLKEPKEKTETVYEIISDFPDTVRFTVKVKK